MEHPRKLPIRMASSPLSGPAPQWAVHSEIPPELLSPPQCHLERLRWHGGSWGKLVLAHGKSWIYGWIAEMLFLFLGWLRHKNPHMESEWIRPPFMWQTNCQEHLKYFSNLNHTGGVTININREKRTTNWSSMANIEIFQGYPLLITRGRGTSPNYTFDCRRVTIEEHATGIHGP